MTRASWRVSWRARTRAWWLAGGARRARGAAAGGGGHPGHRSHPAGAERTAAVAPAARALFSHRTHEPLRCYQCHPERLPAGAGRLHPRRHGRRAGSAAAATRPAGAPAVDVYGLRELSCARAERRRRPAHRPAASLALVALALLVPATARTQKPSPQEAERRKMLDQLGLDKTDKTARRTRAARADDGAGARAGRARRGQAAPARRRERRRRDRQRLGPATAGSVHRARAPGRCWRPAAACHGAGGPAAATRLVLDGNVERDHAAARRLVDVREPAPQPAADEGDRRRSTAAGATLPAGSDPYRRLLRVDLRRRAALDAESPPPGSATHRRRRAAAGRRHPEASRRPRRPPPRSPESPTTPADTSAGVAPGTAAAAASGTPPAETGAQPRAARGRSRRRPAARPGPPAVATGSARRARLDACRLCHAHGAVAGLTRFVLTGPLEARSDRLARLRDPGQPDRERAGHQGRGQPHGGGAPWPEGSPAARGRCSPGSHAGDARRGPGRRGRPRRRPDAAPEPDAERTARGRRALAPPVVAIPARGTATAGAPPAARRSPSRSGPDRSTLNGRFDLNLERRAVPDQPVRRRRHERAAELPPLRLPRAAEQPRTRSRSRPSWSSLRVLRGRAPA